MNSDQQAIEPPRLLFVGANGAAASIVERLRPALQSDFEHDSAACASEFQARLQEREWDLILCDDTVEGAAADDAAPFRPVDLLPLARRIQPQTPVIVLVERAKHSDVVADVVRMMRAGARGVVDKADMPTLIELVQQELENRRPHSASPAPVLPTDEIAARKRAEQELLSANRRWRGILSAIPDLMFHVRSDGTIIDFHGASDDLLLPTDMILGLNIVDFLNSESVITSVSRQSAEEFRTAFAHRQPAVVEYAASNEQSYEARLFPIEESDEFIVVVRNISERRRMEAALRFSEERYRSLVESTDSSIALFDASGQVLYANAIAARALGLTPESMIGRTQWELFPREIADYQMESIRRVIATGERVVHESRTILMGQERWSRTSVQPVRDAAGQATAALINATDITALRASEERYRIAAELMSDYAYSYRVEEDGDLVHEWVTPSYTRITGYEVGEVDFRGRYSLYVPEDQARAAADVQSTLLSRTTTSGEYQFITRQGERRWLQISRRPVLDDAGQRVVRMVGAATDITERKRAEEALHEANRTLEERVAARTAELEEERNLLRTVIDTVPDFIYVKDRQRRMLLNNVAHARSLVALGDVDPLGKTDDDLFPADMAAGFYADEEQLFLAGQSIKNREERTIGEDGSEIWALTTKVPLQNLRGEVIGLVGITKDITAIKTGAEALRASEERYRATIAAMSEGVVVQGTDGAIQLCNEAAERILGLTVDQMVGLTSIDPRWQAVHEDGSPFPGETHPAMVALRTGESQSDVVMGVHKPDGALTWILVNAQPLFHPGGSQPYAVVATFADITARKQAEQTLRQALAQEKELGELKSRFVTLASHEFRTPLAAILATTETLTNYWDRLDKPKIDDRLGRIRAQVAHMTSIMEDVLELARMQAGRVKYEPAPGDLDALCRAILTEYEDQADQGRRLIYECAQPPVLSVFDTRMLRQVIGNLVQNALKYSPESHPVWVTLVHDAEQITLSVQDEGIGIPPEDMKRLFETFHRAANVGAISGTGLGLSIAKQAVELHGGTIAVESALDRGTTFTVRLPRVE